MRRLHETTTIYLFTIKLNNIRTLLPTSNEQQTIRKNSTWTTSLNNQKFVGSAAVCSGVVSTFVDGATEGEDVGSKEGSSGI